MSKQQSIQDMERLIEDVHKNAVAHGWWDKPPRAFGGAGRIQKRQPAFIWPLRRRQ